jgi:hypothetical protein
MRSWTAAALSVALLAGGLGAAAQEKKDPPKDAKKAGAECTVKKTVKGYYCLKCARELGVDDVRNNACKRCETKPAQIEYCLQQGGIFFQAECHPNKKDTKPVS